MTVDNNSRIVYEENGMIQLAKLYYPESELPTELVGKYECDALEGVVFMESFTFFCKDGRRVIISAMQGGYMVTLREFVNYTLVSQTDFSYHVNGCPLLAKKTEPEGTKRGTKCMKMNEKAMDIDYDMLKGCINRMFISDAPEELPALRKSAHRYVDSIYEMGMERFDIDKKGGFMA